METVQHTSMQAASQEVSVSLLSRAAFVLFSSIGSFLIFTRMPRLEGLVVAVQLAICIYEVRAVWALRSHRVWSKVAIKLGVATLIVASIGPLAAWFWLVTFRPPSAPALAAVIALALTSVLFLFYGLLLVVSPQLAFRLDYLASPTKSGTIHASRGSGFRNRVAGLFLLAVGCLLVVVIVRLVAERALR